MLRVVVLAGALGGCLYEEKTFAPPFGCLEDPLPKTDKESAIISGVTSEANPPGPLPGVSLTLTSETLFPIEGPKASGADGNYSLTLPLGRSAFPRMYVKAEAPNHVLTYIANPQPVVDDLELETSLVATMLIPGITMPTIGGTSFPAGTGTIFAKIKDCNGEPVANATLTTDTSERVYYFAGNMPSSAPMTTSDSGVTMIANITQPTITITVHVGELSYRAETYKIEPDAFTQVNLTP